MRFVAASVSNAGPRANNEDSAGYWMKRPGILIAAVADGLGGMGGGAYASSLALETLRSVSATDSDGYDGLLEGAQRAHRLIVAAQKTSPEFRQMATTLTAGVFENDRMVGVHCGDTRAVIARGKGIKRLTRDHSEGERLFDAGKLTKDELATYPRRHVLDSALGVPGSPRIDTFGIDLLIGDRVVFTSDGAHSVILLREMRQRMMFASTPNDLIRDVEQEILSRGPKDNFSIVAIFCEAD